MGPCLPLRQRHTLKMVLPREGSNCVFGVSVLGVLGLQAVGFRVQSSGVLLVRIFMSNPAAKSRA